MGVEDACWGGVDGCSGISQGWDGLCERLHLEIVRFR